MQKKEKLNKILQIVLMVLGALTLLYFVYAAYVSIDYIGSLVKAEQISMGKDFGKVIQYIMTQSFAYLFYGVVFLVMSFICTSKEEKTTTTSVTQNEIPLEGKEAEIQE